MSFRYQVLANELIEQINSGSLKTGEKLPGIRSFAKRRSLSVATVVSAYRLLEDSGFAEVRNRSGYYVKSATLPRSPLTQGSSVIARPTPVSGQQMALMLTKVASDPNVIQLGAAVPDRTFLPEAAVARAMNTVIRQQRARLTNYEMPPGAVELRRQISRRMSALGGAVSPEHILITSGCQEALRLALRLVAEPGDAVAIESPAFYGALQVLDALRLKAVEIPTDPVHGMSPAALKLALENWPIKAVLVVPNNQNPLGFTMSEEGKRQLVAVTRQYEVPLIEDDIYGDLSFSGRRPIPIKLLCPDDDIIYCSSFSKTVSPGLRVGWIVGGRHHDGLEYLKYVSNIATSSIAQLTLAKYLAGGGYERYLRGVTQEYQLCVSRMLEKLQRELGAKVAISQPTGGYILWVQLPPSVDTFVIANKLLKKNISIAPGIIFSASGKYQNCVRISCACVWNRQTENAVSEFCRLVLHALEE